MNEAADGRMVTDDKADGMDTVDGVVVGILMVDFTFLSFHSF